MGRALIYLALLAAGVSGIMWMARLGGLVEFAVGEIVVQLPFSAFLLFAAALFATLHLGLAGLGALRRWPERARQRREAEHRLLGDAALTRALVALAAGTPDLARIEVARARRHLGDTAQTLMLAAEAERLAGREEAAAAAFHLLAANPDSRFLGLRGLLRQAIQRGDWPTAQRLAREAEAAQPGAAWLKQERETLALRMRDWREALALAPAGAQQAPLALAAAMQEADADRASELERLAFQTDPAFTPAALAHARRLREAGSARRARQVLEDAWKARPHPDLAALYLEGEADPLARVRAAEQLVHGQPKHAESRLLVGRLATAAALTGRARQELEMLAGSGEADRRAFLALSDLEEFEGRDTPESRAAQSRWLRRAAEAAPEPGWRCGQCGAEHGGWAPACPACDTAGMIAWGRGGSAPTQS